MSYYVTCLRQFSQFTSRRLVVSKPRQRHHHPQSHRHHQNSHTRGLSYSRKSGARPTDDGDGLTKSGSEEEGATKFSDEQLKSLFQAQDPVISSLEEKFYAHPEIMESVLELSKVFLSKGYYKPGEPMGMIAQIKALADRDIRTHLIKVRETMDKHGVKIEQQDISAAMGLLDKLKK